MASIPTEEQAAIISCSSPVQLLDAVAGSGKTTTLSMVARDWITRPERVGRIACLSFTESAKNRFRQKLAQEEVPRTIAPATLVEFAQFGLNCLIRAGFVDRPYGLQTAVDIREKIVAAANLVWRKYEEHGGTEFDFGFENNTDRIDQLLKLLRRLKAGLLTRQFEEDDFNSIGIYEMADDLDVPVEALEVCAAYERLRRRMPGEFEWQTEDDIVPDLARLLEQHPATIEAIPRMSLFLVDEWHDVNAAEFELIRLLRRGARLVVVADRDQVIDEARGAELKFSTDCFFAAYPAAARLPLSRSRRFGASLSRKLKSVASRKVESIEGLHTVMRTVSYDPTQRASCAKVVVDVIEKLRASDKQLRYADMAIVVREEDQSIEIENALLDRGLPYACEGISSYLLRPEILMMRALLHLVSKNYDHLRQNPETVKQMVSALAMFVSMSRDPKEWHMDDTGAAGSANDPVEQAKEMVAREPAALEFFFSGVLCQAKHYDSAATRRWKQRFAALIETLKGHEGPLSAVELFERIQSDIDLPAAVNRAMLQRSQAEAATRSIRSLISFAARFHGMDARQFLDELAKREQKMLKATMGSRRPERLVLTTVKSAKGHEWPHVIIPLVQIGEFPRSENHEEEKRFLYVAMTRAQDSLTMLQPGLDFQSYRSPLLHAS